MRRVVLFFLVVSLLSVSIAFAQTFGTKKRTPKPHEYGNVVINNFSAQERLSPVVFSHWLHRSQYTCRLCHVDLGFAMAAGETRINEEDNRNGLYCGACHDGKVAFSVDKYDRKGQKVSNCDRCHSEGKKIELETNFYQFVKGFPKARFGNKIDWLKAEEAGLIKLQDELEGGFIKAEDFKVPDDIELNTTDAEMPDILFSHEKHAIWNGCELCHPQIFHIKKSSTVFDMQEIFDGKYCGACHGKVAFTSMDCHLCHTKEVY